MWGRDPTSFFYMWISICSSTTYWNSFPIELLYPCQKSIDHKCEGLFLDSPFYSIDLYIYLYASTTLSLLCSFVVSFEIWKGKFFYIVRFLNSFEFWIPWIFIWILESISGNKTAETSVRTALNLKNKFIISTVLSLLIHKYGISFLLLKKLDLL